MKKFVCVLILGMASVIQISAQETFHYNFNNHKYIIIQQKGITWEQANENIPKGWYLATITTQEEQDFLAKELDKLPILNTNPDHYFIGGILKNNTWQWLNGEIWDYSAWGPGEPNGSSETIVTMRKAYDGNNAEDAWKWNNVLPGDRQSSYFAGYIIEKNAKK